MSSELRAIGSGVSDCSKFQGDVRERQVLEPVAPAPLAEGDERLDMDLVAPYWFWINRREAGTDYEQFEPLEYNVDGLHVLRWYGVAMERDPECPCCGDLVNGLAQQEGLEVTEEDQAAFACCEDR